MSKEPETDFVNANLPRFVVETFAKKNGDDLSTMALQSTQWRCIFVIFEHLNEQRLVLELEPLSVYQAMAKSKVLNEKSGMLAITEEKDEDDEESKECVQSKTIFIEICRLLKGCMQNGPSKNFKVKRLAAYTLFPKLFNLT